MEFTEEDLFLEYIDEPPQAMRSDIGRDEVFELAADIKKNGLINPITVRPKGERYEVVAGHRRLLAHRYGGMLKIRCVVRDLNDDEAFAVMTSENLAREDVNPVDEAIHTTRLLQLYNGDMEKLRHTLNRGDAWIQSRLTIGQMSDELKEALRADKIKIGGALALNKITNDIDQHAVLTMAISQGASVVMANYWIAQWEAGLFGHASTNTVPDSNLPEGQRNVVMLRDALDGNEYPAEDFVTIMLSRKNLPFIDGLRAHLRGELPEPGAEGGDKVEQSG